MKTSTVIEYGAIDVTAKADSNISVSNAQNFSKLGELKKNKIKEVKYSTLEKNHFLLDGKSENMGNNVENVGWWSLAMSDSEGNFSTPLTMTITFSQVHSSLGLTLTFSRYAYCNSLKIQYYDSNNTLITEETYSPDNYEYFCEKTVANYTKIVITFYSTNIPYRYLKLYRIIYGEMVYFEGDNLISANILEQVDLLSNELSINTLDFVVYSDDDRFNILNPQGVYSTLQQRQSLNVYEIKNDTEYTMGTFYIDSWQSKNDNKMEFKGIDLIGLLDKTDFDGGMYTNVTAETLITQIMTSAGLTSELYSIDNGIKNILLLGYIPICTHREALQQVLFTIGAIANCARSDIIELYSIEQSQEPNEIDKGNLFKGTKEVTQGEIITGVSLQTHNYTQGNEQKKLFEGQLAVGTFKITFGSPSYNFTCSGGTIESYGVNHVVVKVTSAGGVVVNGYEYIDNTQDFLIVNSSLNGNEKSNVLKIDSIYLINNSNASIIGQRIIDYYNGKFTTKFKFVIDDEKAGDNIIINESYNNKLNGYVTSLDIDLVGGYVATGEVVAKLV